MKKLDAFEQDILNTCEAGEFKSTSPSKADLAKFKAASGRLFEKPSNLTRRSRGTAHAVP
jgi:hypothetical protein